jgi:hypothetical protein
MTFRTWSDAVKAIDGATGPATTKQLELARQAGVRIPNDIPKIVAAAKLRVALAEELNLPPARPFSDRYENRLDILHRPSDPPIAPQTEEEAYAWVEHLRLMRRRESLTELRINEGDVVKIKAGEVVQVSSIGPDGRVFFKGGLGSRAWPDVITVVARANDDSDVATEARREAANSTARRRSPSAWSLPRQADLSQFAIENEVSEDDIVELEAVITTAEDERPIQRFLEENGHVLTALLVGYERYCLPQKRLGSEFVSDFILGDVSSLGVRWVLVELETPRSGIYLKRGLQFDKYARKGTDQVIDWRNWLSSNISYARTPRSEGGLGLFDIREKSDAIVMVGRRSNMPETTDAKRFEYRQSSNIQIHTYDWLLDTLRGAIRHGGPPASNPYLIPWDTS